MVEKVGAASRTPVLITGESGAGKELVARAIHNGSDRRDSPFIKVNCSALPDSLVESELFGYEKGAFTDAKSSKKGLFELANSGTIFLDEIGEIRIDLQPKLLQVLEAQTFRKVGGVKDVKVDVRIIAATNQDLKTMVAKGAFRQDLYYRLNVFSIASPPLRERGDDITLLAEAFLKKNNETLGKEISGFSEEVKETLLSYDWPGNVRELKNIVERACILTSGRLIALENIPSELRSDEENLVESVSSFSFSRKDRPLEDIERMYILDVLESVQDNKSAAARILGISRFTLREKIKKTYRSH
jgi:transcriptional regulator with PAS, ATPase and Fis domain